MSKLARLDPTALASNPRATLGAWLRYQPFVEAAIARHPLPYEFSPTNIEASTCASRIRDAIRGCLVFHYPCAYDTARITRWFNETVVLHGAGKVTITPLRRPSLPAILTTSTNKHVFDSLDDDELAAFLLLLSRQRIEGPIMVKQCSMPLTLPPNVESVPRPDGAVVFI